MKKLLVINVLDKPYYDDCRIKGSINVPFSQIKDFALSLSKNDEIVVYCAHENCPLSKNAWQVLHQLGFTHVRAYEGGMRDWLQRKFPSEGPCQKDYLHNPLEAQKEVSTAKTITAEELRDKLGC